jgi:hypothetical protein
LPFQQCYKRLTFAFSFQLQADADSEPSVRDGNKSTGGIEDVPIFRTEDEKIEFEQTLNVDLSCVDSMFKVGCNRDSPA